VTTADKATLPTETVWRILHRRWDIENKIFHDLKKFWGFGHNYHHESEAFMAILWLIEPGLFHRLTLLSKSHFPLGFGATITTNQATGKSKTSTLARRDEVLYYERLI
jgi:hypothetical protein